MLTKKYWLILLLTLLIIGSLSSSGYAISSDSNWWKDGSPGDAYNVLAKIAYKKGQYNEAYKLALRSANLYSWKSGGQGEAYLIASIAAKKTGRLTEADELGVLANEALAKSGQVTGSSPSFIETTVTFADGSTNTTKKDLDALVLVYVISFLDNLESYQPPGYQLSPPPDEEIIQVPGLPAIFKDQLPLYRERLNNFLVEISGDNTAIRNFVKFIDKFVGGVTDTIVNGQPISPEQAAVAGGGIAGLLGIFNIIEVLARRREGATPAAIIPRNKVDKPVKFEKPKGIEEVDKAFGVGKDSLSEINRIISDALRGGNLTEAANRLQDLSNEVLLSGRQVDEARDAINRIIKEGTRVGLGGEIIRTNQADYDNALSAWLNAREAQSQAANELAQARNRFQVGQLFRNYGTQLIGGIDKGLALGGIFLGTLENMSLTFTPDGRLIEGDDWYYGLGKSAGAAAVNSSLGSANPGLGLLELGNLIAFGGSKAGNIISPSTTISGTFNYLTDKFVDLANGSNIADQRLAANGYGDNVSNFIEGGKIARDAVKDPSHFSRNWSAIVKDQEFYEGMYDSTLDLFKPPQGAGVIKRGALYAGETIFGTVVGIAEGAAQFGEWAGSNEQINMGIDLVIDAPRNIYDSVAGAINRSSEALSNAADSAADLSRNVADKAAETLRDAAQGASDLGQRAAGWFGSFFSGEGNK